MTKFIGYVLSALFVCLAVTVGALGKGGTVHVNGYTRKDGTYVAPHYRSAPNSTKADNWSTKGNVNPYTGKPGTKPLEPATPPPAADSAVSTSSTPNEVPAASINLTKPTPTLAPRSGIYFTKYENLTREQLLVKVTELDQRNAQLERRIADLEAARQTKVP